MKPKFCIISSVFLFCLLTFSIQAQDDVAMEWEIAPPPQQQALVSVATQNFEQVPALSGKKNLLPASETRIVRSQIINKHNAARISETKKGKGSIFKKHKRPRKKFTRSLSSKKADPFFDQCLSDCISAMCQDAIDWACSDFFPSLFEGENGWLYFLIFILLLAAIVLVVVALT